MTPEQLRSLMARLVTMAGGEGQEPGSGGAEAKRPVPTVEEVGRVVTSFARNSGQVEDEAEDPWERVNTSRMVSEAVGGTSALQREKLNKKGITLRLHEVEYLELRRISAAEGKSLSYLIHEGLRQLFRSRALIPALESLGARSCEEAVRILTANCLEQLRTVPKTHSKR